MTCIFDTRWAGRHGIGRFATELALRLPHVPLAAQGRPMSPLDPFRLMRHRFGPGEWLLSPGYNAPIAASVPYILTIHDLNHIDRTDNSSRTKRLYYRTVLARLCGKARAVLTVSEFSRTRVVDWFGIDPDRVFSVGNGVSAVFEPEGPRSAIAGEYVLCVSNRRGHKNEEGVLRAFAASALPLAVRLVFTGNATPALLELAVKLNIGERLVFRGNVSEADLAALYRGAVFLLFPSFYEGFGLPIIEAFASGTPVISSNVTSMPEIAGTAAMLVDPHSVEAIANAMNLLHASSALRAQLVVRGLARVAAFNWDAVAERVKQAIKATDTDPLHPLHWN
jgi:glycosyltransferase involved in cell wall biosynthesis